MQQYFVEDANKNDDIISIDGSDVHHIKNVMRMQIEDKLVAVVSGIAYKCQIIEIEKDIVNTKVIERLDDLQDKRELKQHVTIALGVLKQEKLEYALQKLTELGMSQFIPWKAKYSIVKIDEKKNEKKVKRWKSIVKEAAEQSKRLQIPVVRDAMDTAALIASFTTFDQVYVAYEEVATQTAPFIFDAAAKNMLVVIGPEGGIAPAEIEKMKDCSNVSFVSLGNRILRAETAAIFSMSILAATSEDIVKKGNE